MRISTVDQPMIFLSDAHLGGFSDEINQRIESELIQLLNYCQRNKIGIAILGDLFDYWMEYPDVIPAIGERVLERFSSFNKDMGPTLFITGNHDNWTRDYFENLGFELKHEHMMLQVNGNTVMTLHGDGLADELLHLPRPRLHRLLRSDKFISLYQTLFPPRVGINIMKYFSRFTRSLEWNTEKEKKLDEWASRTLASTEIDFILCGHDHIPRQKEFDFGTYINLGTFYQHRTMAFYNNSSISLVSWVPQLQSLQPFE
ncbi:UDP-2,3-diacylglucosamine diphosphatase [Fodinibius saliphilus]|uniref:UDP-2,3-diacylglucosamine diphosphatase n=1 Tax=Fodinibius saliphilus TaxID=1920650 RepID=UPI0011090A0F|nr:UDP-2,3-diacylglucosamine diphosphatase [Fodinibius saliphilus]